MRPVRGPPDRPIRRPADDPVYRVIAGSDKAYYGRCHEIAVALGMKVEPDAESSPSPPVRNLQAQAAA